MEPLIIVNLVAVTTIFISLLLSFFLIYVKTQNRLSNRLFAMFLVFTAIDISGIVMDTYINDIGNLQIIRPLVIFLQLPTFYLYVRSVCYSDYKLKRIHLLHLIPFLLVNTILIPRYYSVNLESKLDFLNNIQHMWEVQFHFILIHIQILIYLILAFRTIKNARRLYLENNAGESLETFAWLFQLTTALSVFYSMALFKNAFKFSSNVMISDYLTIGLFVFELVIISWYLLKALTHPSLFRSIDSRLQLVKTIVKADDSLKKSKNNVETNKKILSIRSYMKEEQPFLNPSLKIQDISKAVQIPVRDLSVLINNKLDQHFYDFVNSYRIDYAMDMLKDPSKSRMTVLEILYESGFNSKSSFNTAFKKHTGTTPTSYRKSLK